MRGSRVVRIRNSITIGQLLGSGFLFSLVMVYVYSQSIYYAYVILSLIMILFSYVIYLKNYHKVSEKCRGLITFVLACSLINGILHGGIKSVVMLNVSLILAFALSTMNIKLVRVERALASVSLLAIAFVAVQVKFEILGYINSNTLSFLAYMGLSVSFIWLKYTRKKICPIIYLVISFWCFLQTGSRNVAIVILVCFVLLVVPQKLWLNKFFYRSVYIGIIAYTIFSMYIMELGFANMRIANFLNEYVQSFSEKGWELEKRIDDLASIQYLLRGMSAPERLFGKGILEYHGHNLFYQSLFVYGYVGTICIYGTYIVMFEMAYKLIKKGNNPIVLASIIIMLGHFLIQGADVYMLGLESCFAMPAVIMGLIMQQYRIMFNATKQEQKESVKCK